MRYFNFANYSTLSLIDSRLKIGSFEKYTELNYKPTREILHGDFTSKRIRNNFYSVKNSNDISLKISLIKENNSEFTDSEIDTICKKLFGVKCPSYLSIHERDDDISYDAEYLDYVKVKYGGELHDLIIQQFVDNVNMCNYYGMFNNITYNVVGSKIYGITLTFKLSDNYNYSEQLDVTFNNESVLTSYNLEVDSADNKPIYPKIMIYPNSYGENTYVKLVNATDNNLIMKFRIRNLNTITIDCENKILNNININDLVWYTDNLNGKINWLRLLNGNNVINIEGNASVTFLYRNKYLKGVVI